MDSRRTLIADSALAVIAEGGMRGLTHLAVDAHAELPKGSTSYYCRKRIDLLRLALERLFVIDLTDIRALVETLSVGGPHSDDHLADTFAGMVEHWMTGPRRATTFARFELSLAVAHEPELRERSMSHTHEALALYMKAGATTEPAKGFTQVASAIMLADGLTLSVLRQDLPTPPRADIASLLSAALAGPPQDDAPQGSPEAQHEATAALWGAPTDDAPAGPPS